MLCCVRLVGLVPGDLVYLVQVRVVLANGNDFGTMFADVPLNGLRDNKVDRFLAVNGNRLAGLSVAGFARLEIGD